MRKSNPFCSDCHLVLLKYLRSCGQLYCCLGHVGAHNVNSLRAEPHLPPHTCCRGHLGSCVMCLLGLFPPYTGCVFDCMSSTSPLVPFQMCTVEFGFPAFKAQAIAMRPLSTVAGIPFMYSWSPLQHNFMVGNISCVSACSYCRCRQSARITDPTCAWIYFVCLSTLL